MADDKGFVTFKGTTTGVVDAFYMTQADADAGASDADLTAVQGEQDLDGYVPNAAYWDGTKLQEEIPQSVAEAAALVAMSKADFLAWLRGRVAVCALNLDKGMKYHWAVAGAAANAKPLHVTLTEANTERLDNTIDWGRSWVGYAWRLIKRFDDGESDALTRAQLVAKVELCEAELPNENHILVWYEIHDSSGWRSYNDMRVVYRTTVNNGIGGGIREAPPSTPWSIANWTEMVTDFYEAALTLAALKVAGLA